MTLSFAVLGDSIAFGQGSSGPAHTVGARLAADLQEQGIAAEVRIFAVPGARSTALAAQVRRAREWPAQLVLIIVGANDLTGFVPPGQAAAQLGDAVRDLRAAGAEVVVAPAPDLSVVPWVPPQMRAMVQAGSRTLHEAQSRAALAAGAHVAGIGMTSAAGFAGDPGLFSADRFHPSSAGYAVIAHALTPTVRAAAAEALDRRAAR
ncbi:SGNH/GDSL hydrolase family protein [Actinoplanes siamensis]|uniref:SGNH hydrolase n=1 Tax=Actinoplanes siamensis TaxID=1223317 RepID=A0A919K8A1_9ACTN|nr:SGNH/GDSL hydrolase family protein [Actinoplanes siamensis]GIF02812.1 SGNH hydrolase [Actinoplanes siamensis]